MRVLVCGGRDFDRWGLLHRTLSNIEDLGDIETIIHGNACGADWLAKTWAIWSGINQEPYPAEWNKHGKAARFIRNQQMIDEGKPDLVVAFPEGKSTKDIVTRAKKADRS